MSEPELNKWAAAIDVKEGEIQERWQNAMINTGGKPAEENSYLMEHLASLENQFKRLLEVIETNNRQIEVKDRQIEGLQETVKVLLGKSEDVTILMTTLAPPNQSKLSAATA